MLDLNKETIGIVLSGLKLLSEYSSVDDKVDIYLEYLPLNTHYAPEDWLIILMRMIFVNGSKKVAHYELTDIVEIEELLQSEPSTFEWHYFNFLDMYNYHNYNEDTESSEKFLEDYNDYFYSLEINVLKIYSPIVCAPEVCEFEYLNSSFIKKIPYLVGSYYGIGRRDLLDCKIEKDASGMSVISIYYFGFDYGDLYSNIDTDDIYDEFINAVQFYLFRRGK